MKTLKALGAVLGGLLIACAVLVTLVSVSSAKPEPDPSHVLAAEQASAAALLATYQRLPRKSKSCDSARLAGAELLGKPAAWAYWREHALATYCGGSR